jgi:hypothetical protein
MDNYFKPTELKSKVSSFYTKYETHLMIAFFIGGFLFDLLTLSDPDDWISITQQAIYLVIIGCFLYFDVLNSFQKVQISEKLKKIWEYRQLIVHFLFGSLLSVYSIYYFKSSSLLSSFVFIIIMSSILIANELSRVQNAGHWLKFGMFILCLNAFFSTIYPTLLGFIGLIPFTLSVLSTVGCAYFLFKKILPQEIEPTYIQKQLFTPMIFVQVAFVILYFMGWIPPVPVSAKFMGIYHNVEKKDDKYLLYHQKPFWKFWANGDQTFRAQYGDNIYFFTNIYSPARFSDQVNIRWMHKDPIRGWTTWDLIPMKITGGREEGFRGFTYKSKYQPGEWRVQAETTDGREIGRIYFTVIEEPAGNPREFLIDEK